MNNFTSHEKYYNLVSSSVDAYMFSSVVGPSDRDTW